MSETEKNIALLYKKIYGIELTKAENAHLQNWISKSPANKKIYKEVVDSERFVQEARQMLSYDSKSLWARIGERIHYKNEIISKYEENKKIITTEPKIISDTRVINADLLNIVKKDPEYIHKMKPREFEFFVAEFFEKEGYKVTVTPESRDGGKDIIILKHSIIGNFLIYVECKKNELSRPVGVNIVRELHGTVKVAGATAGIIVTSSYFSKGAKDFTEKIRHQMKLIDYMLLKERIKKLGEP